MKTILTAFTVLSILISGSVLAQDIEKRYELKSTSKKITSENGKVLEVESGVFYVPESRVKDRGRTIAIAYYRIPSKSNSVMPPIFILAGGPGSSYMDALHKKKFFKSYTFYSNFTDVIIFDQRGVGNSQPNLSCEGRQMIPLEEELTEANLEIAIRKGASKCKSYWEDQGVNLSAYNTDESASDVNDLRKAFGYEKIILIGGSYGSHLGLHTLRKFPETIDRAIFHGIEGPDHTWDVPSYTLNTLERIAKTIEASDYYKDKIPEGGLMKAMEKVINDISKASKIVTLSKGDMTLDVTVNKMAVQKVVKYKAGKRSDPTAWSDLILEMYNGDLTFPAKAAIGMHRIPAPNAMKYAMDFSSGISEQRRIQIENDVATHLLGDINFGYTMQKGIWEVEDLGTSFRKNVIADVPVLLVHGNWDMSTPIENAYDILPSLKKGHLIEVEQGTHNVLYECYKLIPDFPKLIASFIKGESFEFPDKITLPPVKFPEIVPQAQEDLWDACKSGDIDKVKKAINENADVNALDTRKNSSGRKPLNWAAYYGHDDIVKLLVANSADINGGNNTGFTPMHHAVENNKKFMVALLLELGADPNKKNKRGKTPLDIAMQKGNDEIVAILKE